MPSIFVNLVFIASILNKMRKHFILSTSLLFLAIIVTAQKPLQKSPFIIRLQQVEIKDLPALQSFAYATWQDKWLVVGGRKDGLHRRQPWAAFDEDGQNKYMYVVDPSKKQVWKQSLKELPTSIQEQLQSTNMQFNQIENSLVLTGGYGYSKTIDDHLTYPNLSIIKIKETINAIINKQPIADLIVQIKDERMAVTGGRLAKDGDTLLLTGGQRFDGMYNPMGPDHGPGFVQQYSNEIRKFQLNFKNNIPSIANYYAIKDSINLHRRDYNLVPQVLKNEVLGHTMFSGVFQYDKDLPYTNFIDIVDGSYIVNESFEQKLSHYHSAVLPMYDSTSATMYTIFFGGIAQYYPDKTGNIISNIDVPFTKTISVISRTNNEVEEFYLPIEMPGYLGAAAEFIFTPEIEMFAEGIANMSAWQNNEILIGYIAGGINSSDQNIFWTNTGKQSKANKNLFAVYIKKAE